MTRRVLWAILFGVCSVSAWAEATEEDSVRKAIATLAPDAIIESL